MDDAYFSSFLIMLGFVRVFLLLVGKASVRRHSDHFNLEATSVGVRMHRNIDLDIACFRSTF